MTRTKSHLQTQAETKPHAASKPQPGSHSRTNPKISIQSKPKLGGASRLLGWWGANITGDAGDVATRASIERATVPTEKGENATGAGDVVGATGLARAGDAAERSGYSISITYTTEQGESATGRAEGVVNSPLAVVVRLLELDGSPSESIGRPTLLLVDEAGNPAHFGGQGSRTFPHEI